MMSGSNQAHLGLVTVVLAVFLCLEAAQALDDFKTCSRYLGDTTAYWQASGGRELTGSRYLYDGQEYIQSIGGPVQEGFLFEPSCDLALEYLQIHFNGSCGVHVATHLYHGVSMGVRAYTRTNNDVLTCQSGGNSTNVCSRRVRLLQTGSVNLNRTLYQGRLIALTQVVVRISQRPGSNLSCSLVVRMLRDKQVEVLKPTIEIIAEDLRPATLSPSPVWTDTSPIKETTVNLTLPPTAATTTASSGHSTPVAGTTPPDDSSTLITATPASTGHGVSVGSTSPSEDSSSLTQGIIGGAIAAVCAVLILVAPLAFFLRFKGKSPFSLHTTRRLHRSSIDRTPGQEAEVASCPSLSSSIYWSKEYDGPQQPHAAVSPGRRYVNESVQDDGSGKIFYDSIPQLPPGTGHLNRNSPRQHNVMPLYARPLFPGDTELDGDDARPMTGPAVAGSGYLAPKDL